MRVKSATRSKFEVFGCRLRVAQPPNRRVGTSRMRRRGWPCRVQLRELDRLEHLQRPVDPWRRPRCRETSARDGRPSMSPRATGCAATGLGRSQTSARAPLSKNQPVRSVAAHPHRSRSSRRQSMARWRRSDPRADCRTDGRGSGPSRTARGGQVRASRRALKQRRRCGHRQGGAAHSPRFARPGRLQDRRS